MRTMVRVLVLLAISLSLVGCSKSGPGAKQVGSLENVSDSNRPGVDERVSTGTGSRDSLAQPQRPAEEYAGFVTPSWFFPSIGPDLEPNYVRPDGSREHLIRGMRAVISRDGAWSKASRLVFPSNCDTRQSLRLPQRLGGGYVFQCVRNGRTLLWKAADWLAPMEPLVELDQRFSRTYAGFDRVYLVNFSVDLLRSRGVVALDPVEGKLLDYGNLPEPIGAGPMLFADNWRAVAFANLRGVMFTGDGGVSWQPVVSICPSQVHSIYEQNGEILIRTTASATTLGSIYRIDPKGIVTVTVAGNAGSDATVQRSEGTVGSVGVANTLNNTAKGAFSAGLPISEQPLTAAIRYGHPVSTSSVALVKDGDLLLVRAKDGTVEKRREGVISKAYDTCQGVSFGDGVAFVCARRRGPTTVFAYQNDEMRQVVSFTNPREVFSNGSAAIAVRGPCPNDVNVNGFASFCVIASGNKGKKPVTLRLERSGDGNAVIDEQLTRVVALDDGRLAAVIPPVASEQKGDTSTESKEKSTIEPPRLVLVEARGGRSISKSVVLSLGTLSSKQRAFVETGMWMGQVHQLGADSVGVWVDRAGKKLGLSVGFDGTVDAGAVTVGMWAMVSGRFGLVWNTRERGMETVDGGLTWSEVFLPEGRGADDGLSMGCSAVGCSAYGWHRIGWKSPRDPNEFAMSENPQEQRPVRTPETVVDLICTRTGRTWLAPGGPSDANVLPMEVRPSFAQTMPIRVTRPGTGKPDQSKLADKKKTASQQDWRFFRWRTYLWKPQGVGIYREASWAMSFPDPFALSNAMVTSARGVAPSEEFAQMQDYLSAEADPVVAQAGDAALVTLQAIGGKENRFAVAPGLPPVALESSSNVRAVNSVALYQGHWYMLARGPSSYLQVLEMDETGATRVIGSYPIGFVDMRKRVALVTSSDGNRLGLLVSGVGLDRTQPWQVLAIDASTGAVESPQTLRGLDPAKSLERCRPGNHGWVLDVSLQDPYRLVDRATGNRFERGVRFRVRASEAQTCVQGMTITANDFPLHETKTGEFPRAIITSVTEHRLDQDVRSKTAAQTAGAVPLAVIGGGYKYKVEMMCEQER